MTKVKFLSGLIRLVFLGAFGAFMWASLHHVATYFHAFEPDNTDWYGSYALAGSIDGTALMLTIGVMFFGKEMPRLPKVIVWGFIIGLTAFSWVVNWEYAVTFQSSQLTNHLDPAWQNINPVMASSFAALNLAYAIVSEFFGAKPKTLEELQVELDSLTGERATLLKQIRENKGPGVIARLKETAIEAKQAVKEVMKKEDSHESSEEEEDDCELFEGEYPNIQRAHTTDPLELLDVEDGMSQCTEDEREELDSVQMEDDLEIVRPDTREDRTPIKIASIRLTRRKPMSVGEVATVLKCTEKTVREMRKQGKLKAANSDGSLITVSSVNAVIVRKQRSRSIAG